MEQKHPCPDCTMCQWCSDERCRVCMKGSVGCRKRMSLAEQIERYEELNRREAEDKKTKGPP